MSDTPAKMFDYVCNEVVQIDGVYEKEQEPDGVRHPPRLTFWASSEMRQKEALATVRKYGGHVESFRVDEPTVTVYFPFAADE